MYVASEGKSNTNVGIKKDTIYNFSCGVGESPMHMYVNAKM